jgi:NAD(P) transhydrogenase subunit alpha
VKIDQIIVLKESRSNEGRVALTPETVALLSTKKIPILILIESGAGHLAGLSDEEYIKAGAKIFTLNSTLPANSLILRVKCPTPEREKLENKFFSENNMMMGFLDPLEHDTSHIARWKKLGMKLISLELLRITGDDPRNAQAAMSRFAGELALHDALKHYEGSLPKNVMVIGTGPAGLSAAITASKLKLPIVLLGRNEKYRKKIEDENIVYHVLPEQNQQDFIRSHLADKTIVITAARNVGEKSPILIDEKSFQTLPEKSVIVDLSAGEGGNVVGSKQDAIKTIERGIKIMNVSGYPKIRPKEASEVFAQCMVKLLQDMIDLNGDINLENILIKNNV